MHQPAKAPASSSEESSESESDDEKPKAAQVKATPKKASSSSDSDSSSEDEAPTKAAPASAKKPAAAAAKAASSGSESSSDEDEAPKKTASSAKKATPAKAAAAKNQESSDEDSDEESSEDEDVEMAETGAKTNGQFCDRLREFMSATYFSHLGKRKADDDDAAPAKKVKLVDGGAAASSDSGKTIFVGRLSWNVDNDWLAQEFAECGEVVSARVQMDRNTGKSRGFAYVTFATAEAVTAALALNGKEIDGRPVNIDKSVEKDPDTARQNRAKTFGDSQSPPSASIFVGNLSFAATEDELWEKFSEFGDVKGVRIPTDRDTGRPKGFAYVEFTDVEASKKAVEGLAGAEIGGRAIRLDFSQPRDSSFGGRDSGFGGRGGRGGGDRGGRGRGGVSGYAIIMWLRALIVTPGTRTRR